MRFRPAALLLSALSLGLAAFVFMEHAGPGQGEVLGETIPAGGQETSPPAPDSL